MSTFKTISLYLLFVAIINTIGYHYFFDSDTRVITETSIRLIDIPESTPLYRHNPKADKDSVNCLAKNIFHEARNQSREGQLAVAFVTINRMKHVGYPNTVCGVVYDSWQFSWTHSEPSMNTDNKIEKEAWEKAVRIAVDVLTGKEYNDMYGVTHYHADYIEPHWMRVNMIYSQIDQHVFYTEIL